jgi:two-component system, chemotaxis family, chemotaxis protein CheY
VVYRRMAGPTSGRTSPRPPSRACRVRTAHLLGSGYTGEGGTPRGEATLGQTQAATQSRVLVVDDDPGIRDILGSALQDDGYEVREAVHGADALEVLAEWPPDVILLDLMMPVMDGWTFRARQLELAGASHIPVVVLSAAHEATRQARIMGAAAVMAKPFDLDAVGAAVSRLLGSASH